MSSKTHKLKEKMLPDCYEYSQGDTAEKLFLCVETVRTTERRAIEKFKQAMIIRGITIKDLLP